jgi:hypothetical protein
MAKPLPAQAFRSPGLFIETHASVKLGFRLMQFGADELYMILAVVEKG